MAIALDMSKSAAQYYLRVAARKLGARNRVHAVAIAVELGLVKPRTAAEAKIAAALAVQPSGSPMTRTEAFVSRRVAGVVSRVTALCQIAQQHGA